MANLRDFKTQELVQELIRRIHQKKASLEKEIEKENQTFENEIAELDEAIQGLNLAIKVYSKQNRSGT